MELINLTPHVINVVPVGGDPVAIEPSGTVARVSVQSVPDGEIAGIPVVKSVYGEVEGLPEPQEGVAYIVSMLVGQRVTARGDLYGPDSGPSALRNERGQIVGVRQLVRF